MLKMRTRNCPLGVRAMPHVMQKVLMVMSLR